MSTKATAQTLADIRRTLTVKQAATALGVSPRVIYNAIAAGTLPATIPGGRTGRSSGTLAYRILPADLRSWFFGHSTTGGHHGDDDTTRTIPR